MEKIGDRILLLMKERHLSQRDLAMMIGVTESALSRYINNEREPKLKILSNLATALGTTIDYLITGAKKETDFDEIYRLVARGSVELTIEEKMQIIEAVMKNK